MDAMERIPPAKPQKQSLVFSGLQFLRETFIILFQLNRGVTDG